jgi:hypothetical protein
MKRLIFLLFFVGFGKIVFGQDCIDLTQYQKELGEAIEYLELIDITSPNYTTLNKARLTQIKGLLKPCTGKVDFMSIRNIFFKMDNSIPFKVTLLTILENNNSLCVDITEGRGKSETVTVPFKQILDSLINVNEKEIDDGIGTNNDSKKENLQHFKAIENLLSDCTNLTELEQLEILNEKINTKGFGDFTGNFVSNFREALSGNISLLNPPLQENISKNNLESNEDKDINLVLLLAGVFIVPILLIWLFETKNEKVKQKAEPKKNLSPILSRHKVEYLEKENLKLRNILQSFKETTKAIDNNINTEEQLKALNVKDNLIASQQRELERLKAEIKQLKQVKEPETPKIEKLLFFAEADWQGNFIASNATKTPKLGASIYRFLLNEESDEAIFEFYNMPSTFLSVMNNPGVKLFNVCIADNDFNGNANKIETIKKGKVILKKGKWLVAEKALIRFSI